MNEILDIIGLLFSLVLVILILVALREPIRRLFFEPKWNLFVSHRRTDNDIVNPIVEILKNRVSRVWIDTSEIDEEKSNAGLFRRPISIGIQKSSFALLFTSEEYCGSDYCMEEANLFLRRFVLQPNRIIEIRLDQNDARKILGMSPTSEWIDLDQFGTVKDEKGQYEALVDEIILIMGKAAKKAR